jgi:hypothetical protein
VAWAALQPFFLPSAGTQMGKAGNSMFRNCAAVKDYCTLFVEIALCAIDENGVRAEVSWTHEHDRLLGI